MDLANSVSVRGFYDRLVNGIAAPGGRLKRTT